MRIREVSNKKTNSHENIIQSIVSFSGDALIEEGVDTNGDSNISPAEAEAVDSLNVNGFTCGNTFCYYGGIESLVGIEAFTNLEVLFCGYNQLTSLPGILNLTYNYFSAYISVRRTNSG